MPTLHGADVVDVRYGERTLHFDPLTHTYHVDSLLVRSVTQYLKDGGYCHVWNGDGSKATLGRYVHEATAYADMGDLSLEGLAPEIALRVEQWERFKHEEDFVPDLPLRERPCFHPIYFYAGTPDVPGTRRGQPCVVELKTGAPEPWHPLQVGGGYTPMLALQVPRYEKAESLVVYLDGHDRAKVVPATDARLPALFLSITACVNGRSLYGSPHSPS